MAASAAHFRLYQRKGERAGRPRLLPEKKQIHARKGEIMKRNRIAKTFIIAAVSALAMGIAPAAKAASNKGCSVASLNGTYADKDTGFIIPGANAAPLPFAGVNAITFDGNGNMTATGFSSVGGSGAPQVETGTYTVNPDCTGKYSVTICSAEPCTPQTSGSIPADAFFVIDDTLSELQIVITDLGNVITCVARRQFPIGDWRQ